MSLAGLFSPGLARAERPAEDRAKADYVLTGLVTAVYRQETKGYFNYIVEIKIEQVHKGPGFKKGDTFRAFCYQRKPGVGGGVAGLEFDSGGHGTVPTQGQQVRIFVNRGHGWNEGVYPDWVDVLGKAPAKGR
jgi:hypothetical protein